MIRSFADRHTEALFEDRYVARFSRSERQARRKRLLLHNAISLDDLRVPPANRLERVEGGRAGQYSIRINDQWRICFRWNEREAWDVEIADYH